MTHNDHVRGTSIDHHTNQVDSIKTSMVELKSVVIKVWLEWASSWLQLQWILNSHSIASCWLFHRLTMPLFPFSLIWYSKTLYIYLYILYPFWSDYIFYTQISNLLQSISFWSFFFWNKGLIVLYFTWLRVQISDFDKNLEYIMCWGQLDKWGRRLKMEFGRN